MFVMTREGDRLPTGAEASIFGNSKESVSAVMALQFRSQASHSQQSVFSQGVSSQRRLFSQISQNSLDDVITNEQIRPDRFTGVPRPKEGEQLARQFLLNPYKVVIGSADLKAKHAIRQHVDIISEIQKYNKLVKLLEDIMDGSRILILIDTKKVCDQITRQLRMDGWPALSIHGDKSRAERDWVLSEFKAGKSPIMMATDVAARVRCEDILRRDKCGSCSFEAKFLG